MGDIRNKNIIYGLGKAIWEFVSLSPYPVTAIC